MPTIDLSTLTAQEMVREAIKRVLDQATDRVKVAIDATVAGGQEILIGHSLIGRGP